MQHYLAYDLADRWEPNGVQLLTRARGVRLINSSQATELSILCDKFYSSEEGSVESQSHQTQCGPDYKLGSGSPHGQNKSVSDDISQARDKGLTSASYKELICLLLQDDLSHV